MAIEALLVDDSRSALDFFKALVEGSSPVRVTGFLDPIEALEAARKARFDIAMVDYEMPGLDGISLIRELRKLPTCAEMPIIMITSVQDEATRLRALEVGATDFLPKRPGAAELRVRLSNLIRLARAMRKLNDHAATLTEEVAAATRLLNEREEEIILRLALAVEYRDNDTGEHTLRVAKYSRIIAEELGLSSETCRNLYLAAPLHDVGKVAIPDHILLKPGRLDDEEMAIIRTHAEIGGSILANSRSDLIRLAGSIAANHHERWDGSGYPCGLAGEDIPISSRILAIADVFDALTTKRPYKEPMSLPNARSYLEEQRGRQFDPACIDAFLRRWDGVVSIYAAKPASTTDFESIRRSKYLDKKLHAC